MNLLHPLDLLRQARIRYSQGELTSLLGADVRTHVFVGDITKIDEKDIPDHDVLDADFRKTT